MKISRLRLEMEQGPSGTSDLESARMVAESSHFVKPYARICIYGSSTFILFETI